MLFDITKDEVGRLFRDSLDRLKLLDGEGLPLFALYGLGHGGATQGWLRGRGIEVILERGRWKRLESLRHYLDGGKAILTTMELPAEIAEWGRRLIATRLGGLDALVKVLLTDGQG